MLAAEVWHWWIGVVLTVVAVGAGVALVGGYLKTVESQRYPGGKRKRENDL
jgi:formate-dependent nitrite reductase membrane component NrfD